MFSLILKLFTLVKVIFNTASRHWILLTSGEWYLVLEQKSMEYLLNNEWGDFGEQYFLQLISTPL